MVRRYSIYSLAQGSATIMLDTNEEFGVRRTLIVFFSLFPFFGINLARGNVASGGTKR